MTSVALVHIAAYGRKETGEIALAPNPEWENNPDQEPRTKIKVPKEEDYILKMSDVLAARLRARLVVLSCCHSGRGEVKSEDVVSIARAFLAAGARSVLASLWAISDEATMEVMKTFYQQLKDGQSASVALHQAMKTLRDSGRFHLIGDDIRLQFENKILRIVSRHSTSTTYHLKGKRDLQSTKERFWLRERSYMEERPLSFILVEGKRLSRKLCVRLSSKTILTNVLKSKEAMKNTGN